MGVVVPWEPCAGTWSRIRQCRGPARSVLVTDAEDSFGFILFDGCSMSVSPSADFV